MFQDNIYAKNALVFSSGYKKKIEKNNDYSFVGHSSNEKIFTEILQSARPPTQKRKKKLFTFLFYYMGRLISRPHKTLVAPLGRPEPTMCTGLKENL